MTDPLSSNSGPSFPSFPAAFRIPAKQLAESSSASVRAAAALELAQLSEPCAQVDQQRELLLRTAAVDSHPLVGEAALSALNDIARVRALMAETIDLLLVTLGGLDRNRAVLAKQALAHCSIPSDKLVGVIESVLQSSTENQTEGSDPWLGIAVADLLSCCLPNETLIEASLKLLRHPAITVREAVLEPLGRWTSHSELLIGRLETEIELTTDENYQNLLRATLVALGIPLSSLPFSTQESVREIIEERSESAAKHDEGSSGLGAPELTDPAEISTLLEQVLSYESIDVEQQAALATCKLTPEHLPLVLTLSERTDTEGLFLACGLLGRLSAKTPGAVERLLAIIQGQQRIESDSASSSETAPLILWAALRALGQAGIRGKCAMEILTALQSHHDGDVRTEAARTAAILTAQFR